MIDPNWIPTKLSDLRGAYSFFDATDISGPFGLIADNCQFIEGEVGHRYGFAPAWGGTEAMTSLDGWVSSLGNYALYFQPTVGVRFLNISTLSIVVTVAETAPYSANSAIAGARNYLAFFNTTGVSTVHGYAVSYSGATLVADKLFPPPLSYVPSAPTEPSTGTITKGTHLLGYRIKFRSGYKGRPGPNSASGTPGPDTFAPISFTAAGVKNLSWTLNTAWPTGAVEVQVIMTPVSNKAQWYEVPNAVAAVTGGTSHSVSITFDISDEELRAPGINDVTDSQFLMSQTMAAAAPFNPHKVFACGNRMGYVTTFNDSAGNAVGSLMISERDRFQEVYGDRSLIQCPDLPIIRSACYIGNTVYMFGPDGTFATSDTGLDPSAWPTPRPISRSIGTLAVEGVEVSPDEKYAWVVDRAGLQLLQEGAYAERPISYAQSDVWRRINWAYAHTIEVKDFSESKIVAVKVPLDAATSPSHILTWNYSRGRRWDRADYSLWTVSGYSLGAIGLIQNDWATQATANVKKIELCLGPSNAAKILRQMSEHDTTPYRDSASTAISWRYRTMLLPPGNQGTVMMHFGGHVRARGAGTLTLKMYGRDDAWNAAFTNTITLASAPGVEYWRALPSRNAEQVSIDFAMNTADQYCRLSGYVHRHFPHSVKR